MDREGASLTHVVKGIRDKLKAVPLLLQVPLGSCKDFDGVVDVIAMQELRFGGTSGSDVRSAPMSEMHALFDAAKTGRAALFDALVDLDPEFMEVRPSGHVGLLSCSRHSTSLKTALKTR